MHEENGEDENPFRPSASTSPEYLFGADPAPFVLSVATIIASNLSSESLFVHTAAS